MSPNCNFDFLQIHDGPSASSHMIGKYCGSRAPNGGSLNTTSFEVYLWFRSDASVSSDGFEVVWSSSLPSKNLALHIRVMKTDDGGDNI